MSVLPIGALGGVILIAALQPTPAVEQRTPEGLPRVPLAAPGTVLTPLTKLEALVAAPDALLVKDFYRVGTRVDFPAVIEAVVVTELRHRSGPGAPGNVGAA